MTRRGDWGAFKFLYVKVLRPVYGGLTFETGGSRDDVDGVVLKSKKKNKKMKTRVAFVAKSSAAITCQWERLVLLLLVSLLVKLGDTTGDIGGWLLGLKSVRGDPSLATPCHVVGNQELHNGRLCPQIRLRNVPDLIPNHVSVSQVSCICSRVTLSYILVSSMQLITSPVCNWKKY